MPRKPIACPACGALVSHGRLSCPACGTLVAAVTGGTRPVAAQLTAAPASAGAPAPSGALAQPAIPVGDSRPWAAARRASPVPRHDPPPATATNAPTPRTGSILQQLETRPVTPWLQGQGQGEWQGQTGGRSEPPAPQASPIPGAYLAPSAAFSAPLVRSRPGRAADPATSPRSPVPTYATSATAAAAPVAFAPRLGGPAVEPENPGQSAKPAGHSVEAPAELPGWLAIAGSAIAAVSFLMPWSRDGVIGAVGSGYFDRWGLANAGYLPLVLAALALLAVNGIPKPIPGWIRAGVAPLAIGGILFGLDWAYQTRPYSDGLGVTMLLVAALVLVAGGIVGVRSGRHPVTPPLV